MIANTGLKTIHLCKLHKTLPIFWRILAYVMKCLFFFFQFLSKAILGTKASSQSCFINQLHNFPLKPFSQDYGLASHTTHTA